MFGSKAAQEAEKRIASLTSRNNELAVQNNALANEITELRAQIEELAAANNENEITRVNEDMEALKIEFANTLAQADNRIKELEKEVSILRFEKETVDEEAEKLRNSEANLSGRSMVDMLSGFNSMLLQATTAVADTKQIARDKMIDVVSDFNGRWQQANTDLSALYTELDSTRNKAEYAIVAFVKEAQRLFKDIDKRTGEFRVELSEVSAHSTDVERELIDIMNQLTDGAPKQIGAGETEEGEPVEETAEESPLDELVAETAEAPVDEVVEEILSEAAEAFEEELEAPAAAEEVVEETVEDINAIPDAAAEIMGDFEFTVDEAPVAETPVDGFEL